MNPNCAGLIGNGVVVHLPSFFEELDALQSQGLDCTNRLFISDRAQLVFDFHQIVDGLKEVELGGSRYVFFLFWVFYVIYANVGRCVVASAPRRRGSAPRTPERPPDLVFESTTSSTMRPLRSNSASWSKVDTNDTGISSTIPKEKYFDTRLVQQTLYPLLKLTKFFPDLGIGGKIEAVRRR